MSIPEPRTGLVINYSFLWNEEAKKGQEEGLKDRPCIIIAVKDNGGDKTVVVAPITHSPPTDKGNIEVPAPVKSRLGLDDQRSWVVTSEVNQFSWSLSPDLRPVSHEQSDKYVFGMAPANLIEKVREDVRSHALERTLSVTKRDENAPSGSSISSNPDGSSGSGSPQQKASQTHQQPEPPDLTKPGGRKQPQAAPSPDEKAAAFAAALAAEKARLLQPREDMLERQRANQKGRGGRGD